MNILVVNHLYDIYTLLVIDLHINIIMELRLHLKHTTTWF